MNATIHSWFARPALTKGAIHTIAIACCTYDISDVLAEGLNLRNTFLHLTLFSLMKLFLMRFSYIGNVVSAQLIHKETPPALKAHSSMPISTVCPYHWIKLYVVF